MRQITAQSWILLPQQIMHLATFLKLRWCFLIVISLIVLMTAAWRSFQVVISLDNKPLLIDSEDGLLYTSGLVGDKLQTLVLSANDGHLIKTFDITGSLALDPVHNLLYVCNDLGVVILNAQTGELNTTIGLPQAGCSFLEVDPTTSQILAIHDNTVYVADAQTGKVLRSIPFNIPINSCGEETEELTSIRATAFDSSHQLIYLIFANFHCTPWYGETIVAFDLVAGKELERKGGSFISMVAFNGYLYGTDWHRFGIGYRWVWQPGQTWFQSEEWNGGNGSKLQVDSKRQRLYEVVADGNLRVFDIPSMTLRLAVPQPVTGTLIGYDAQTDQLYLRTEAGQLNLWSAAAIEPGQPQLLQAAQPPAAPANFLAVSPQWPEDKTLLGLWNYQPSMADCYVFGQSEGRLYFSNDGGNTWGQPTIGLPANCGISTLALSPNYGEDQTILVGIAGWGLFRSTNSGQSWTPSSEGLASMGIEQILLSPGFGQDGVAFTKTQLQTLYRSDDGGQSWQALPVDRGGRMAISAEFEQNQTLMKAHPDYYSNTLQTTLSLSRDGGYHWEQIGPQLEGEVITLSLAPLFDKWHVVFAFSDKGLLYRSSDGGLTWEIVLDVSKAASAYYISAQLVFAPNIEANRPVFFLVSTRNYATDPPSVQGTLYRSGDGGLTWQEATEATAMTVSPTFTQDGLLFLGLADGQVKTWSP